MGKKEKASYRYFSCRYRDELFNQIVLNQSQKPLQDVSKVIE